MDTAYYKQKLLEEKEVLLGELSRMAKRTNPRNPKDWEPSLPPEGPEPDPNIHADRLEDYEEIYSQEVALEARWNEVNNALARIEKGTYGVCETGGKRISEERLSANPAARTCTRHAE